MVHLIPKKKKSCQGHAQPIDHATPSESRILSSQTSEIPRAATKERWKTEPMPSSNATVQLNFRLDKSEARDTRLGFIPNSMDDRWFAYFEDNVLHIHRSWTGHAIWFVRFKEGNDGALIAYEVLVNRDEAQVRHSADPGDEKAVTEMVLRHLPSWRQMQREGGSGQRLT